MHDQNFKNLTIDYPKQSIELFASVETTHDLSEARIIPLRQEQLMERLGERFRELDTPLLVEWPDGRREAILFVIEEESKTSIFSIHRLAHYCLDLSELMETDRLIPVVIFLKGGSHKANLRLGSDENAYLEFRYVSCTLNKMSAVDYYDSNNIVARINLPNMNYPAKDKLKMYYAAQKGLAELEKNPEKQMKYLDFIDFYADLSENEVNEFRTQYMSEKGGIMGLVNVIKEEGRKEGRKEGHKEGRKEGHKEGCKEGFKKGGYTIMLSVIKNAKMEGMSDQTIAKMLNIDISTIQKLLNNENIDIPLHLLNPEELNK